MKFDLLNGAIDRALGAIRGGEALPEKPATVDDAIALVCVRLLEAWMRHDGPIAPALDHLIDLILTNPKDPTVRGWGLLERQQIRLGLKHLRAMKATPNAEGNQP